MAADSEVVAVKRDLLVHEYETEWKINKISTMKFSRYRSLVFSPISWMEVRFCLDVLYQKIIINDFPYSCLNVSLKKMSSASVDSSVKFEYQVDVEYPYDQRCRFKSSSQLTLADWSSEECIQKVSFLQTKAELDDALILKCFMKISGHIPTSEMYSKKMNSLNNLTKFAENFDGLFSSGASSDIVIRTGEATIPAHKCVLASHSPVFKKMLEQDFLESKTNTVVISDFEPETIESFLKFLYSADINDKSFSNVKQLYILADKYDVQFLRQECVSIIKESFLTLECICEVLRLAGEFNDSHLKNVSKVYAADHIQEIITESDWNKLVTSFPMFCYEIVASNYLSHVSS